MMGNPALPRKRPSSGNLGREYVVCCFRAQHSGGEHPLAEFRGRGRGRGVSMIQIPQTLPFLTENPLIFLSRYSSFAVCL